MEISWVTNVGLPTFFKIYYFVFNKRHLGQHKGE